MYPMRIPLHTVAPRDLWAGGPRILRCLVCPRDTHGIAETTRPPVAPMLPAIARPGTGPSVVGRPLAVDGSEGHLALQADTGSGEVETVDVADLHLPAGGVGEGCPVGSARAADDSPVNAE